MSSFWKLLIPAQAFPLRLKRGYSIPFLQPRTMAPAWGCPSRHAWSKSTAGSCATKPSLTKVQPSESSFPESETLVQSIFRQRRPETHLSESGSFEAFRVYLKGWIFRLDPKHEFGP